MITLNRSTDLKNDTFWITLSRDGARCRQLYLGKDVNGAIGAAVTAGLLRQEAVAMAQSAIKRDSPIDTIQES